MIINENHNFNHSLFDSTYSIICPIINERKLVGAIVLFDKETRQGIEDFNNNDLKLLDSITIQTSFAYQNVKLLESLKKSN